MSRHRSGRLALAGLLAPGTVLLACFFLVPLGIMAIYSLLSPGLYGGVEWEFYPFNYGRVLGAPLGEVEEFDPVYAGIFLRSLRLALVTVAACLILCYPAAFWVSRLPGQRKPLVLFLVTLPFFASLIIRIYAWMLVLKPTGVLTRAMEAVGVGHLAPDLMFTEAAVVIGLCYVLLPFMFLPIYASVEKLDPALLQASDDLGATPLQGFLRVTLPLTAPGVLAGCLLVFIPALGNFIVPALLGGAKVMLVGNTIEQQFLAARNWPFGAALAMLVLATILLAMLGLALRPRGETGTSRA
jgi:spermidine/putrescine transport system permease protein